MSSVLQDWVMNLPFMQQSVLIAAMCGPDGVEKGHKSKSLARWYRRCVVISAFDKRALIDPCHQGGGSYTGPSLVPPMDSWEQGMDAVVKDYLDSIDSLPHHYHLHFLHGAEVIGYQHPDTRIKSWWRKTYFRLCHDMHTQPETEEAMNTRLNDDESAWRKDESRFKQ